MLPKQKYPVIKIEQLSTQKMVSFRPFTVGEEKLLHMSNASDDVIEQINTLKQVINNCCMEKMNVDVLPIFDIEYFFLMLRGKSINDVIELQLRDEEDNKLYRFEMDINKVEVIRSKDHSTKIQLNDKIGMIMNYPSSKIMERITLGEDIDPLELTKECIKSIYDETKSYPASETEPGELEEFLDSITTEQLKKISQFFDTIPYPKYTINYKNSLGHDKEIVLQGIRDFFQ